MDDQWFLTRNGETIAQFSTEQFRRAVNKGIVRPGDYVRRSDSSALILADDFLPKPHRRSRGGAALSFVAAGFALAGIFAGAAYGVSQLSPELLQSATQSLMRLDEARQTAVRREAFRQILLAAESPFYRTLAEKDPQAFEDMLTYFSANVGQRDEDLVTNARAYLMKTVLEPRSRYLSDDDKYAMLNLSREFSQDLAGTNPKLCIAQALGRPFGDVRPFMTPELARREEALMLKMLEATPRAFDLAPAAEVQALNGKVAAALYQAHGEDVALLDLENVPEGKEEQACRMFSAYLEGVLSLPENERIALVRAMMLDPDRLAGDGGASAPASEGSAVPEASPEPPSDTAAQAEPPSAPPADAAAEPEAPPIAPPAPREAVPPGSAGEPQ